MRMRLIAPIYNIFFTLSHKQHDFRKKKNITEPKICFEFLNNFCVKRFSFWEKFSNVLSQIYVDLHVKYIILVRFEKNLNFRDFRVSSRSRWDLRSSGLLRSARVPSSRANWPLKLEPIGCTEKSVRNYHCTRGNIPKQRRTGSWISSIDIRKILQFHSSSKTDEWRPSCSVIKDGRTDRNDITKLTVVFIFSILRTHLKISIFFGHGVYFLVLYDCYKKLPLLSTAHCSPTQEVSSSNTVGTHNILVEASCLVPQKNVGITPVIGARPLSSSYLLLIINWHHRST